MPALSLSFRKTALAAIAEDSLKQGEWVYEMGLTGCCSCPGQLVWWPEQGDDRNREKGMGFRDI